VQCIRAGEAIVRVQVTASGARGQTVDVQTIPDRASATVGAYLLTLTDLQPVPLAGKPTAAADYRATFVLAKAK
jgi:hypothetical protein